MTRNHERNTQMKKALPAFAVLAAVLAFPAAAAAHVSIHPNEVPAGAFATLDVRVPGEQQGAHITQVDMLFPPGFVGVDYQPVPGWSVKIAESPLAKPLTEDGETIDSQVAQVTWTWSGPGGRIEDGQFVDLPLSVAIPRSASGHSLVFKTVQHYSDGHTVRWIDPGLEEEHPSPRILVTAPGGLLADQAGAEAGPTSAVGTGVAAAAAPAPARSGGASEGLAVAALVVGALGLLAAIAAIVLVRRARTP